MPIRSISALLGILWLSGCSTNPLVESEARGIPFLGPLDAQRFVLKNGLKIVVVEDPSSPTFAYQTWFNVGSRDEKVRYTGLAHLFEHMMFKGTSKYKEGEFDRVLEGVGTQGTNAFTSNDLTAYVQELPKQQLELIMELESDRMVNLIVNEKSFTTEREVVQNERRYRNENSPAGRMYQVLYETVFNTHPYHWPVIGYEEDLKRTSAKEARDFYKAHYHPSNATVIVIGDVKASQVLDLAIKHYGALKNPELKPAPPVPSEPKQTSIRRKTLPLSLQVEKLFMAYHTPPASHEDTPTLEVIEALLSDGNASRLTRSLVETGIASSVSSGNLQAKDPSFFIILADLQQGKKSATAEAVIVRELERLRTELVPETDLQRAKNLVQYQFYLSLDDNSSKAHLIGQHEIIQGSFRKGLEIYQKVPQVTAEDVLRVAKAYFDPNGRTVVTGVPK